MCWTRSTSEISNKAYNTKLGRRRLKKKGTRMAFSPHETINKRNTLMSNRPSRFLSHMSSTANNSTLNDNSVSNSGVNRTRNFDSIRYDLSIKKSKNKKKRQVLSPVTVGKDLLSIQQFSNINKSRAPDSAEIETEPSSRAKKQFVFRKRDIHSCQNLEEKSLQVVPKCQGNAVSN